MHQTAWITLFNPMRRRFKIFTVTAFVTERPNHDRRTVFVPLDIGVGAIQYCGFELRIAGKVTEIINGFLADSFMLTNL